MAKKKARQVTRDAATSSPVMAAPPSASRGPVFNPDYAPVIRDLKRIGLLAGTFVGLLVVLSLFLR